MVIQPEMLMESLTGSGIEELRFHTEQQGPSSRNCCRIVNGNSCGSGALVGRRNNGNSLVFSNAHVTSNRIGNRVELYFPFSNQKAIGRVIMAGYSDRVMMDWSVVEVDKFISELPHVKLNNRGPIGTHYTGGYPRCRGPMFQNIVTRSINGSTWLWDPNAVGGQSGSAIHSKDDNLQYGLLTWTINGRGAGQTTRGIWQQYIQRRVVGQPWLEGLRELGEDNRAAGLTEGFSMETNITTLPIWHNVDPGPNPDPTPSPEFARKIFEAGIRVKEEGERLIELARQYADPQVPPPDDDGSGDDDNGGGGPTFDM